MLLWGSLAGTLPRLPACKKSLQQKHMQSMRYVHTNLVGKMGKTFRVYAKKRKPT